MKAGILSICCLFIASPPTACKLQEGEGRGGGLSLLFPSEPLPRAEPGTGLLAHISAGRKEGREGGRTYSAEASAEGDPGLDPHIVQV